MAMRERHVEPRWDRKLPWAGAARERSRTVLYACRDASARRKPAPGLCFPAQRAGQRFALRREDHAVEAAVEAVYAKDPTLRHAPVEAADEAADAEDRLPLPLAPVEAADAAHP